MASVVFLRAVNVGRTNRCQPALIAKQLSKFDVLNIGAVGTFIVSKSVTESALRAAIAKQLSFKCEIMVVPAKSIVDLAKDDPLAGERNADVDAHVSFMTKRLARLPTMPIYAPSKEKWEIEIRDIVGTAVISLRRRVTNGHLYPNAVVEKAFGLAATTRSWSTIRKVATVLERD